MYKCLNCWYTNISHLWKCPECNSFSSMKKDETKIKSKKVHSKTALFWGNALEWEHKNKSQFFKLSKNEFNRTFQWWIKDWWVYLLWWQPWIGKSTIILQIIQELLDNNTINIWYFTWEEAADQIFSRLNRITNSAEKKEELNIYSTSNLEDIIQTVAEKNHDLFVIDSIQTVYSPNIDWIAGSPSQVKFCAEKISEFAKKKWKTCFIIWHVTKWWEIAGPKYLEHIVDMVSYLEWDRFGQYRFLRSMKNRFWSTDDVWIFEMWLSWLTPVYDITDRIINTANTQIPWSVFTIWIDNWRPVIVNLEVLLNKTNYKYPQRVAIWIDNNRLNLITAILERYLKVNLWYFDIYVNLPGEFKFFDSWLDLALIVAIFSQYKNKFIENKNIYVGEIGLGWQVLPSKLHEKRKKETPKSFNFIDNHVLKNITELSNIL